MAPWSRLDAPRASDGFDGVTVTFLGVSTLVIRDPDTTLMIDGFFTRPDLSGLGILGAIAPDPARVEAGLALGGVDTVAAITTVHSHFDHAMDTPVVAEMTGALVIGSASTANIARGWGLPDQQIREVSPGDSAQFGAFTMKWYASKHYPLPGPLSMMLGTTVDTPLVPPARVVDWAEGRSDTIVIEHPRGTLAVQGSAGFIPGALDDVDADVVLLGIGGIGRQDADYQNGYWSALVTAVSPDRIYPLHWDDFNRPLSEPLVPSRGGAGFAASMEFIESKGGAEGIAIGMLPLGVPVEMF
jgi:L-ascorbate metabolism protein UlaG (beta-lactamase superfamily)